MDDETSALCDAEVVILFAKRGYCQDFFQTESGFISTMFVIPKKTVKGIKKFRPILNLKRLNSFVRYEHFKMEGLDSVKYLLKPNDWLVKIDLQDAYFLVPVAAQHRKYLRFFWKGVLYEYVCLPFGLCSAPRVFTKILKPIIRRLRAMGIRFIIYLYDMLIMGESPEEVQRHLKW